MKPYRSNREKEKSKISQHPRMRVFGGRNYFVFLGILCLLAAALSVAMQSRKQGLAASAQINIQQILSGVVAIPGTDTRVMEGDIITLGSPDYNVEIFFTTDGSVPEVEVLNNGNLVGKYTCRKYVPGSDVEVPGGGGTFRLRAIAVSVDEWDSSILYCSPVADFIYTYGEETKVPFANPAAGRVPENTQVILQSPQEDAVIHYEIAYNGDQPAAPTAASPIFDTNVPIVISKETVIKAFALRGTRTSGTVTLRYQLTDKMKGPQSSLDSGSVVPSGTAINLTAESGTVYYTTDGSEPADIAGKTVNRGNSVILMGNPGDVVTVRACTRSPQADTSDTVTFTYQISQYPGGVKADKESGATVADGDRVSLMTDVTNGIIYHTLNGGSPLTEGVKGNEAVLTGAFGSQVSLQAVAIIPGTMMTGSPAFFQYKMMDRLQAPLASLRSQTVLTRDTRVSLEAREGVIFYTIDGSEPTEDSHEYIDPIMVSREMTIKAIAVKEGYVSSEVSSFTYSFAEKVRAVTTDTAEGVVEPGEQIVLSCGTRGAEIFYTTDGSEPDALKEDGIFLYNSETGINIHRSVTIKAVASKAGMCDSDVLTLNYIVDGVPIELERQRALAKEREKDLMTLDIGRLQPRRVQAVSGFTWEEVTVEDIMNRITVGSREGVLPADVSLSTKQISVSKEAEQEVKLRLGAEYEVLANYGLVLYHLGERVQPKEEIEIRVPIPQEHLQADITLANINDNGSVTLLETRRDEEYVYAKLKHLGNCAIIGATYPHQVSGEWNNRGLLMGAGACILWGTVLIIRAFYRSKHRSWNDGR